MAEGPNFNSAQAETLFSQAQSIGATQIPQVPTPQGEYSTVINQVITQLQQQAQQAQQAIAATHQKLWQWAQSLQNSDQTSAQKVQQQFNDVQRAGEQQTGADAKQLGNQVEQENHVGQAGSQIAGQASGLSSQFVQQLTQLPQQTGQVNQLVQSIVQGSLNGTGSRAYDFSQNEDDRGKEHSYYPNADTDDKNLGTHVSSVRGDLLGSANTSSLGSGNASAIREGIVSGGHSADSATTTAGGVAGMGGIGKGHQKQKSQSIRNKFIDGTELQYFDENESDGAERISGSYSVDSIEEASSLPSNG